MFECGFQDNPTAVLSAFRPARHRRHRREKAGNPSAMNYTLKSPLSLIITTRYAVARHSRKPSFHDPRKGFPGRLGGVRLARIQQPVPPVAATSVDPPKTERSRSAHLCLRETNGSE